MTDSSGKTAGAGVVQRTPLWVRLLLIASLTFNLLVLGIVAGTAFGPGRGMMGGGPSGVSFGPFTEALSGEDRKAMRDAFVQRMPQLRQDRRQVRADIAAIQSAVRTDPLDEAALRMALDAQRNRIAERLGLGQDLLIERISAMTPAARAAFADRLEDGMRRSGRRGDAKPDGGNP